MKNGKQGAGKHYLNDPYKTSSFSAPQSLQEAINRRAIALGLTRSYYIRLWMMQDVYKGSEPLKLELPVVPKAIQAKTGPTEKQIKNSRERPSGL
jgi:hypothetical protein